MFLGPALPTTCHACGKQIGVPWLSALAVIPLTFGFIILCVALFFSHGLLVSSVALVLGFLLAPFLALLIPLEKR
jgi:Zn-dependent protease with chaperone function